MQAILSDRARLVICNVCLILHKFAQKAQQALVGRMFHGQN